MAAVLLTAGAAGKRYALPHSNVMIHQPLGGVQGQATEIEIHAREILRLREELNGILSRHSGQPIEKIRIDTERDNFMTAEEAKSYGLIDNILHRSNHSVGKRQIRRGCFGKKQSSVSASRLQLLRPFQ